MKRLPKLTPLTCTREIVHAMFAGNQRAYMNETYKMGFPARPMLAPLLLRQYVKPPHVQDFEQYTVTSNIRLFRFFFAFDDAFRALLANYKDADGPPGHAAFVRKTWADMVKTPPPDGRFETVFNFFEVRVLSQMGLSVCRTPEELTAFIDQRKNLFTDDFTPPDIARSEEERLQYQRVVHACELFNINLNKGATTDTPREDEDAQWTLVETKPPVARKRQGEELTKDMIGQFSKLGVGEGVGGASTPSPSPAETNPLGGGISKPGEAPKTTYSVPKHLLHLTMSDAVNFPGPLPTSFPPLSADEMKKVALGVSLEDVKIVGHDRVEGEITAERILIRSDGERFVIIDETIVPLPDEEPAIPPPTTPPPEMEKIVVSPDEPIDQSSTEKSA